MSGRRYEHDAPFGVEVSEHDGVRVFAVHGDVDIVTSSALARGLAEAPPRSVVDLGPCRFLDSTGLRVVLELWMRLGAGFALAVAPDTPPSRVLELAGVDDLPVRASVDEAVAAVRAG